MDIARQAHIVPGRQGSVNSKLKEQITARWMGMPDLRGAIASLGHSN
jgi:hypothetical protein